MSKYNGLKRDKRKFEKYHNNNCYTYAINQPINPYTNKPYEDYGHCQPGYLGGKGKYVFDDNGMTNFKKLTDVAKVDLNNLGYEFVESSYEEYIDDNCWKIAFCYSKNDYHWYRQNKDGTWSHKIGTRKVLYKDHDDKIIRNPETCNRGKYKYFGGYYLIKKVS
jgi:hypothetical protein